MSFIWPSMLYALVVIPLFILIYFGTQGRRKRIVARNGSFGGAQEDSRRSLGWRRHMPPVLFAIGLTILFFALSRPQAVVSLPKIQGNVILAFDVSGSMAADDLKPTRMDAAKAAARDFVQNKPTTATVQIGVVAFSDSGVTVQVPTDDQAAILAAIDRLTPQRGTSLAQGILASLNTISATVETPNETYSTLLLTPTPSPTPLPKGQYTSGVIILLTDGENNERPDPLAVAQVARDRGIRIYTIGLGSTAGTTLHVNGFTVHSQLDEQLLKQISSLTDGVYYNAENEKDLVKIYDNLYTQLVSKPEKTEITFLFAGAGILILLLGGLLSLVWFSRLP